MGLFSSTTARSQLINAGRYRQQRICQMRISYAPGVFLDGTTGKNTSRSTIIINVPKWMKMVAAH